MKKIDLRSIITIVILAVADLTTALLIQESQNRLRSPRSPNVKREHVSIEAVFMRLDYNFRKAYRMEVSSFYKLKSIIYNEESKKRKRGATPNGYITR